MGRRPSDGYTPVVFSKETTHEGGGSPTSPGVIRVPRSPDESQSSPSEPTYSTSSPSWRSPFQRRGPTRSVTRVLHVPEGLGGAPPSLRPRRQRSSAGNRRSGAKDSSPSELRMMCAARYPMVPPCSALASNARSSVGSPRSDAQCAPLAKTARIGHCAARSGSTRFPPR